MRLGPPSFNDDIYHDYRICHLADKNHRLFHINIKFLFFSLFFFINLFSHFFPISSKNYDSKLLSSLLSRLYYRTLLVYTLQGEQLSVSDRPKQDLLMTRGLLNFLPALKALPLGRPRPRKKSNANMSTCGLQRVADVARDVSPITPSRATPWRRRNQKPTRISETRMSTLVSAVSTFDTEELGLVQTIFNPELLDDDPHGLLTNPKAYRLWKMADQRAIAYVPVVESPSFTMVVFVFPPGSTIPLHDHVGMTVVSRVLWGSLEIHSFDVVTNIPVPDGISGVVAKRRPDDLVAAGETRWLTPEAGNVHSFTAKEWTAVFDVLVPPYDERAGRSCSYYRERSDLRDDHIVVLEVSFLFVIFRLSFSMLTYITFLTLWFLCILTNFDFYQTVALYCVFVSYTQRTQCSEDYVNVDWPYEGVQVE